MDCGCEVVYSTDEQLSCNALQKEISWLYLVNESNRPLPLCQLVRNPSWSWQSSWPGHESTPSLYSMLTSTTKANIIFEFSSAALNQPPCFLQQSESMTTALQYSLLCDLLKNSWSWLWWYKTGASCLFGPRTASKIRSTWHDSGLQPNIINSCWYKRLVEGPVKE